MKNLLIVFVSFLMVTPVLADMAPVEAPTPEAKPVVEQPAEGKKKKRKPLVECKEMRKTFSADQKADMKEARMEFQATAKKLRKRLRRVRRRYRKAIADVSVEAEVADRLALRRNRIAKKIRDNRVAHQHTLIYDIGTDEQRPVILKCLKARKKRRAANKGIGTGKGKGPKKGMEQN